MPGMANLNPDNTPISSGSMTPSHALCSTGLRVQKGSLIGHALAKAMSSIPDCGLGTPDPLQASDLNDPSDADVEEGGPFVSGGEDPQSEQEEAGNLDIDESDSSDDDDDEAQCWLRSIYVI
jgi:hypothetical protein